MSKEKMAKKNGTNGATVTETPAAQVPEVTKKEKLALFKAYEDAEVAVDKLEAQLVEARVKRSEAVRAIAEKCGNGPFGYKGAELRIIYGAVWRVDRIAKTHCRFLRFLTTRQRTFSHP